jgi:multisubunit Na+/H+ antiporter MnhC subunit
MDNLVPVLGILTGIIIPLAVFVWLYHEEKGKRETVLEISKHIHDPSKVEDLLSIFDERKKQPIDYRRGGVITLFVGVGLYLLGAVAMGKFFEGVGLLVGAIGVGTMIAGYFFPNTSEELTDAVEKFEEK